MENDHYKKQVPYIEEKHNNPSTFFQEKGLDVLIIKKDFEQKQEDDVRFLEKTDIIWISMEIPKKSKKSLNSPKFHVARRIKTTYHIKF